MKTVPVLAFSCALALVACGDDPAPKPAPKAEAAVAAPAAAAPAPAPQAVAPAEPPKPDPNTVLAAQVKRALEGEAKIQAAAIDVTAANGKVTLWGTAASDAERERAGGVASKVDGVKAVDNKLAVVTGS